MKEKMRFHRLTRRDLLKQAGQAAALSPFVPLLDRHAEAATAPKRLIFFFVSSGCYRPEWEPAGTETNFKLKRILEPLEAHKKDLMVLRGVDWKSYFQQKIGNDHQQPFPHTLTAADSIRPATGTTWYASAPSIDQFIAAKVGGQIPSLVLGVPSRTAADVSALSWRAANTAVPAEKDPRKTFERVFAGVRPTSSGPDPRVSDRRSTIDFVLRELAGIQTRIGAEDRRKIEAHIEGLRAMEKQFEADSARTGSICAGPNLDAQEHGNPLVRAMRQNIDIVVSAMACNLTRVAQLQWGGGGAADSYTEAGITGRHHSLSHYMETELNREQQIEMLIRISRLQVAQLAYLIEKMKQVREGDGTLFSNSAVLFHSEHGLDTGRLHDRTNLPFLLAGSAGGYFRTGRFVSYPSGSAGHGELFVSLCHAMGLAEVKTFGNPTVCRGPLPGLT